MKKILIIEDEKLSAERLRRLLADIDDTLEVEGPLTTVEKVVEKLRVTNDYNLVFSDIRLKSRLVFEAFREVMPLCPVVFTTAYDEYALEAFRHNGVGYLLKPIDLAELSAQMEKIQNLRSSSVEVSSMINAASRQMRCYRERILVTRGDELVPLRVADVRYFSKEENAVMAYTSQGESLRIPMTMNDLEEQLNPNHFFRLNRQYIAHISAIRRICFFFSSKLIVRLTGCQDEHIVVSKEKSAQFKAWLDR